MSSVVPSPRKRRPRQSTVVFYCVLVTLIGALVWINQTRRSLGRQVAQLKTELLTLRKQSREREAEREQTTQDREILIRVFRKCRRARDVPRLGGDRIVATLIDGDAVVFYIPDGNHQLIVKTSWEATPVNPPEPGKAEADSAANRPAADPPDSGEKTWTVPLIAEQGYRFENIGSSRHPGPLAWNLTSGASDFSPQSGTLPLPSMRSTGSSWTFHRIAEFPNRVPYRSLVSTPSVRNPAPPRRTPLQLGRWTKFGHAEDKRYQIYFELKLVSDNPPIVTASDAESVLILRREEVLDDYLGGGRYGVRQAFLGDGLWP